MSTDPSTPLRNSRHEAFAQSLARGLSATSAYIAAGYSAKAAGVNAYRLIKKASVAQRLAHLKDEILDETIMTAKEVLARLSSIARDDGAGTREQLSALNSLARYHGLFVDRVDHTTSGAAVAAVHLYLPDNGRDTSTEPN